MNNEEILLCTRCMGVGHLIFKNRVPGHNAETNVATKDCRECEGSGRIVKKTSLSFEPYVPSDRP